MTFLRSRAILIGYVENILKLAVGKSVIVYSILDIFRLLTELGYFFVTIPISSNGKMSRPSY